MQKFYEPSKTKAIRGENFVQQTYQNKKNGHKVIHAIPLFMDCTIR